MRKFTKFDWLESFEIGFKSIDDDHRKMLAIMKQVGDAGAAAEFERCAELLDELFVFSKAHFEREEALLDEIGYPAAALHKSYHAGLLVRADAVKEACKAIRSAHNFRECCEEMFGFLIDDVVAGDLKIKSYMQEIGMIP